MLTYWQEAKKEAGGLKKIKLTLAGLGTLYLMPWRIEFEIKRLKQKIKTITGGRGAQSLKKYLIAKKYREDLKKLRGANNFLKKELKRHQAIRKRQEKMRELYQPIYQEELKQRRDGFKESLEVEKTDLGRRPEYVDSQSEDRENSFQEVSNLPEQ